MKKNNKTFLYICIMIFLLISVLIITIPIIHDIKMKKTLNKILAIPLPEGNEILSITPGEYQSYNDVFNLEFVNPIEGEPYVIDHSKIDNRICNVSYYVKYKSNLKSEELQDYYIQKFKESDMNFGIYTFYGQRNEFEIIFTIYENNIFFKYTDIQCWLKYPTFNAMY